MLIRKYVINLWSNPLLQRAIPSLKLNLDTLDTKIKWAACSGLLTPQASDTLKLAMTPQPRVSDLMADTVELLLMVYQKLRLEGSLNELEAEFAYHSLKHLMQLQKQVLLYAQTVGTTNTLSPDSTGI